MTGSDFADKVAIVTGGGRGIGRAAALQLAERGALVTICARSAVEVHAVADLHPSIVTAQVDVDKKEKTS